MENKNKIEIPFGAKDSELCECEYTIADGYEAEIKDGKVIIRKVESEDERIRKDIISYFKTINSIYLDAGEPISRRNAWIAYLEKQGEKKTAWSEEDKKMIGTLIAIFEVNYPDGFYKVNPIGTTNMQGIHSSEIIKWLKFLKDRILPQPKQEWSEEDEKRLDHIIQFLEDKDRWKDFERAFPIEEDVRWLKSRFSLKQCNYNPYKATVESIAEMCEKYKLPTSNLSDFLDNVKVKCKEAKEYDTLFPHSTWKPSEAQMIVLNDIIINGHLSNANERILKGLQEQLKSL